LFTLLLISFFAINLRTSLSVFRRASSADYWDFKGPINLDAHFFSALSHCTALCFLSSGYSLSFQSGETPPKYKSLGRKYK